MLEDEDDELVEISNNIRFDGVDDTDKEKIPRKKADFNKGKIGNQEDAAGKFPKTNQENALTNVLVEFTKRFLR